MTLLCSRFDAACQEYFQQDRPYQPRAIMAGYDLSQRGSSLVFVMEDHSVDIVNLTTDIPKVRKHPKVFGPEDVPEVSNPDTIDYVINGVAYYTHFYQPLHIVHEDYALRARFSPIELAVIGGNVRRLMGFAPGEHHLVQNTVVKGFMKTKCGRGEVKGKVTKEIMVSMISAHFNQILKDNNEADAFALMFWGMTNILGEKRWKPTRVRKLLHTPEVFQNHPL